MRRSRYVGASARACGAVLAAVELASATSARAETTVQVHGEAAGAAAIAGWQRHELGFGALGGARLEIGTAHLGLEVGAEGVRLGAGEAPTDPTLAPTSGAGAVLGLVGLRFHPFGRPLRGVRPGERGLWIAVDAGGARTGGLTRAAAEGSAGWDFGAGALSLGPEVGLVRVFQPSHSLRADDAVVAFAGVHVAWPNPAPPPPPPGDRDRDGIVDPDDRCPDEPEDRDGFQDEDGCPDPDDDGDGVLDREDACPRVAGIRTGDPKTNGCPDGDRDHDGISDSRDKCPNVPEDLDGFEDDDGCPDDDNDGDGILDPVDRCPLEPETFNGYADEDGCPDDAGVRVLGSRIVLDDRVYFDTDSARVQSRSFGLLRRVAMLLRTHPEYQHVEVHGYADDRGADWYNDQLSDRRARSVRDLLVLYGVAGARISTAAHGKQDPRKFGSGEATWRENRRVELAITSRTTDVRTAATPGDKR